MLLLPAPPGRASLSITAHCVAFPLLCHSLVCNGSSKVKLTEMLISEGLAHSALEIRILVHYTQLLAEQSAVTGKHNARARGSGLELKTWSLQAKLFTHLLLQNILVSLCLDGLEFMQKMKRDIQRQVRDFSSKSSLILRHK